MFVRFGSRVAWQVVHDAVMGAFVSGWLPMSTDGGPVGRFMFVGCRVCEANWGCF